MKSLVKISGARFAVTLALLAAFSWPIPHAAAAPRTCMTIGVGLSTQFPSTTPGDSIQVGAAAGVTKLSNKKKRNLVAGSKVIFSKVQGSTTLEQIEGPVSKVALAGSLRPLPSSITVTGTATLPTANNDLVPFKLVLKATHLRVVTKHNKKVVAGFVQSFFYVTQTGALYLKSPKKALGKNDIDAVIYAWKIAKTCGSSIGGGGGGKR